MGVALTRDLVCRAMGSETSGTLDLVRLGIGSCGRGGVLMATLGGGCGVIVVKFPHVTLRTLGEPLRAEPVPLVVENVVRLRETLFWALTY